ncbi:MAG: RluA family pseudouridine synthase [Alphaproteobacteria bacterium]|nr:RluA family pseudouridine synthase [Alphaproteobacteria bacterium]MBU0888179.1 RluA family pseudouridine synthase [Alphaproteobacteria bacterium]MBU1811624.1 RluA family pseudouridine synthase [Alphaproteobacteria bacterium]MBU2088961.1 RluA family pseudouridine synthase [Alphaproteobacteria bacterium]
MSAVETRLVTAEDAETRLDRWFRKHFPALSHGRLEKLLRTGQVRVDGKRVKASQRLEEGQAIRVPPLGDAEAQATAPRPPMNRRVDEKLAAALRDAVLHRDSELLVINKPAGLAVQGGTNMTVHVDALLDALVFDGTERPRLVHRLDKDTSGVLVLARTAKAARWLTAAFREKDAEKLYWAVTAGVPKPYQGRVDLALAKLPGKRGEKMDVDEDEGRRAISDYAVIEAVGKQAAFVALRPVTGRTHQLRVHMQAIGTPILGDGKYGGAAALLAGDGLSRKLHLHARRITLLRPNGKSVSITAPLPPHMAQSWEFFGFSQPKDSPFEGLE